MRHLFHFEPRHHPLISRRDFARRLARNALWGLGFILVGLIIGIAGYMGFADKPMADAFLNAAMILSGMGPVGDIGPTGGKIFAGIYALVSGIFIFAIAGIVLAPLFHRMMHRFHLQDDEAASKRKGNR